MYKETYENSYEQVSGEPGGERRQQTAHVSRDSDEGTVYMLRQNTTAPVYGYPAGTSLCLGYEHTRNRLLNTLVTGLSWETAHSSSELCLGQVGYVPISRRSCAVQWLGTAKDCRSRRVHGVCSGVAHALAGRDGKRRHS
jgi:hypothetical protein